MASEQKSNIAPKQKELTRSETITSFNAWRDQFLYVLSFNKNFTLFLRSGTTWSKASSASPHRGFVDDTEGENRVTKEEKVKQLDLFLGQIANYAPVISRNQITKNSTSLNDIWSKLREHYGIQTSGAKFIGVVDIQLGPGERYEDLYQRILAFFEDNLLTTDCGISHHGDDITTNEELTPSLENMVVLIWLQRIHEGLPGLIKQKYGAELRNKTLSSLKSEISAAIDSLLGELKSSEGGSAVTSSRVMRAYPYNNSGGARPRTNMRSNNPPFCCLCHASKRSNTSHWISKCPFLPEADKKRFQQINNRGRVNSSVRFVDVDDEDEDGNLIEEEEHVASTENNSCFIDTPAVTRRVTTRKSPHLQCFFGHNTVIVCLDTGAESNLVSHRFVNENDIPVYQATQGAVQADAKTPMGIVGEVKGMVLTKGPHNFTLDALVTQRDIGDVIGGEPFLEENDIAVRPRKKQIIIGGRDIIPYQSL